MTDTATEGSVVQETASAGAPDVQPEVVDNGSATTTESNPFSGLHDEGARKWVETKGYKSPEDIVKAAQSLEQRLGTSLTIPKDDAPAEEWDKFYSKLPEPMRPVESPDKLDFKRPEGLPEELPYNEDLATAAKSWMHEAKLSPTQAQAVHDRFAGFMADQQKAALDAQSRAVSDTAADLTKEWGPQDSEGFKQKLALADRAAKKLGLDVAFKKTGVILPDGALTDPQIAKALAVVGETMFAEDTIGNDPVSGGANPFAGEGNITQIMALAKNDPDKAKRLAKEAGKDPRKWGL